MPNFEKARVLILVALAAWTIAWFLPSYQENSEDGTSRGKTVYGWYCFKVAVLLSPRSFMAVFTKDGIAQMLGSLPWALSPWTNFLVPIAVLAFNRGRLTRLRRRLPALLIGSGLLNLTWLLLIKTKDVRVGYYLWVSGFLALGIVISTLLKGEAMETRSLFVSDGAGVWARRLPQWGAVLALLALGGLVVSTYARLPA